MIQPIPVNCKRNGKLAVSMSQNLGIFIVGIPTMISSLVPVTNVAVIPSPETESNLPSTSPDILLSDNGSDFAQSLCSVTGGYKTTGW